MGAVKALHERLIEIAATANRRRITISLARARQWRRQRAVGVERAARQISYGDVGGALKAQSREWPMGSCRPSSFAAGHRSLSCPQAQPS